MTTSLEENSSENWCKNISRKEETKDAQTGYNIEFIGSNTTNFSILN